MREKTIEAINQLKEYKLFVNYTVENKLTEQNKFKIDKKWESILTQLAYNELQIEVEGLKEDLTRQIKSKFENELDITNEFVYRNQQYDRLFGIHSDTLDKIIECYFNRITAMYDQYHTCVKSSMAWWKQIYVEINGNAEGCLDNLITTASILYNNRRLSIQNIKKEHEETSLEHKSGLWTEIDALQVRMKKNIDNHLILINRVIDVYTNTNEAKRKEVVKLEAKDQWFHSKIIEQYEKGKHLKRVRSKLTKERKISFRKLMEDIVTTKEKKRKELEYYLKLKRIYNFLLEEDRQKLLLLSTLSSSSIQKLESTYWKKNKIVKVKKLCKKFETPKERVTTKSTEFRYLGGDQGVWKLDGFWEHIASVEISVMELKRKEEQSLETNLHLKNIFQTFLFEQRR